MSDSTRGAALVFGGARGIGAAAVRRLAADGYPVAFTFVSRPDSAQALVQEVAAAGGRAHAIQADSASADAIIEAVRQAVEKFGLIKVVVVNAGIYRAGTIGDVSLRDLDEMLSINVRAVFLSIQAALPHLVDGARVITIGSNVAVRTGIPGASVYQLTKTAVAGLVKGAALDLAPRGITVNNIQPGPIETDLTASMIEALKPLSPLRRVGQPHEVGALISYLAGDEAGYMTGASLTIDGGFTL
ncbi:3-oxoacyl-[acyl-carrier protein] reductase [Variovorax paradoxus]|nr:MULTISPECIES: SDR family oxidoreductase [Variovorax]MBB3641934.1 3-oxoacyl-[acyl-carrier protein] reductase [Variovorax sp. BK613]MDR6522618.1 3-oxoacyl-[acyl-carrier protein] reductase [Variovorax paradoxus]